MTLSEKFLLEEDSIPADDLLIIQRLRKYLRDTPELNELKEVQENTDTQLYHALLTTIDDVNTSYPPETTYSEFTRVPWVILRNGATLEILVSVGITSARNTLTYRDPGGVTVQDYDVYGRYINFYNVLYRTYAIQASEFKKRINIEQCYGGLSSEYIDLESYN